MKRRLARWLLAGVSALFAACAIITVNVYFPEKDVKQAYKSLDEMLLKQGQEKHEGPKGPETVPPAPAPEEKPRSMFVPLPFSLVATAWAADDLADALAVELSSMPDVLKAYDEMNARLPQLNALRDSGAVGETNQGLVSVRDAKKVGDKQQVVKAENDSRKIVINGMARAILKINKQAESKAALNTVLGRAAATYAETRREAARPGWWVQLANGRWVQK